MANFDKSEELREEKLNFEKLESEFKFLKLNFNDEVADAIRWAEKPLKEQISEYEDQFKALKDKMNFSNNPIFFLVLIKFSPATIWTH